MRYLCAHACAQVLTLPPSPSPSCLLRYAALCSISVSLGEVELELLRRMEGLPAPQPLARFTIAEFWVTFRNTVQVSLCPSVCV